MCCSAHRWGLLAARTAIAVIFINSGIHKILGWQMTAGYMAAKGMPFVPFFLVMSIILELGGSLLLITGLCPRVGAMMLLLMLIPTTLIFHNFWAVHGSDRQMQMGHFLSNLAIIGGLGVAAQTDSGRGRDGT
jgi:putative oxidoreductase